MRHRRQIILVVLSIPVLAWFLILALNWHSRLYRVTVLPKFKHRVVTPCAINDHGQIVGSYEGRFLLWERDTGWRDLGESLEYLAINNRGQIAGTLYNQPYEPGRHFQAFLWDPNDGLTMLGTMGSSDSWAHGLNNLGQVVGLLWNNEDGRLSGEGERSGFIWSKAHGMRALRMADGSPMAEWNASGMSINDAGQIVGCCHRTTHESDFWQHCLWRLTDDGLVLESVLPANVSRSPNNHGYVIGWQGKPGGRQRYAFLWHQDRGIEWLFPLEDPAPRGIVIGNLTSGLASVGPMNDSNQVAVWGVVHSSWLERLTGKHFGPSRESFLWTRGKGQVFLDAYVLDAKGEYFVIHDINNTGSIIGIVDSKAGGARRAVLLEPIRGRWHK